MLAHTLNKFQRLSIRYKLSLIIMLTSIVMISGATLFIYQHDIRQIEASEISHAHMQASLIGASIESALAFQDTDTVQETLNLLQEKSHIEYIGVMLTDNTLFADSRKETTLKPTNEELINAGLINGALLTDGYFDVVEPVRLDGELLGYIFIRSNINKINNKRAYYHKVILSLLILCVLMTYLFVCLLQHMFTAPLTTIVEHVAQISKEKNYQTRLALKRHDEFAALANGFNHMLDVVQEREDKLTEHSANLQNIVTERTKQLYQQANYDSLTELPNRHFLMTRLEEAIEKAKAQGHQLAILFMDIDRFKVINDSLGHNVGDQLLRKVAKRLNHLTNNSSRSSDIVARLGGDEFVYLIEQLPDQSTATGVAKKISQLFEKPLVLEDLTLHVSTSVGISLYPDHGNERSSLLKSADVSMYYAKAKGPGSFSLYETSMNSFSYQRLELETHLRSAIANEEFHLVYQPQIAIKDSSYQKAEALLRWDNPQLGRVSPANFIPIAEETGYINEIGSWVIATVCQQLAKWRDKGASNWVIGINISSSHLLAPNFVDYIQAQVAKTEISYHQLELEITEEVFLAHSDTTIEQLKKLQALGIKIAIDDFGTGYSSLQYLKDLPLDTLKLDGMFIRDLQENGSSRGIVNATIILAHSLNLRLVAECVENKGQLDFLLKNGCDLVQGYYLYKPLTAKQLALLFN